MVWSEPFGYIVLCYYVDGRFEDNHVFDKARDLYDFLLDHWQIRWLYLKSKENGVEEYEDYEKDLTGEQREEREQTLTWYGARPPYSIFDHLCLEINQLL